jgi:RNA polymerase sigma-32 factor
MSKSVGKFPLRTSSKPQPEPGPFQGIVARSRVAPRLTRERERELLSAWQTSRDRKAAEELAKCSMRYVVAVAFKLRRYDVPLEVLISEGNLGLVRAMDKFDLAQDTRFSTYSTYWIRYYMMEHIMRSWTIVGGGSGALKTRLFFRIRRERARAWSLYGEGEAADALVAERLHIPRNKLSRMVRQLDGRDMSLNVTTKEDSNVTLQDTLSVDADQEKNFGRQATLAALAPVLKQALETLTTRERAIVEDRLMADDEDEQSLSKLGERFGISRERVRQIEDSLKGKLRDYIAQRCNDLEDLVAA